ncbi:hypothetical protein KIN20_016902 [Parelaphostrongylus tenuis]|uniref:Secreted protein n=1 Tax=Parelaphostrongylus tenuis TaxID=148309 RepID=A0AAD5MH66_PARTN|nr:hypothetical protein KIN20_016902 [Parelaphostrongylus tenuis]
MRAFEFCLVISITVALSYGDCGCGSKCAIYTGPAKCTRCCTATVKRSLDAFYRRSQEFLPPISDDQLRKPMWFQPTSRHQPKVQPKLRHHRLLTRSLLERILAKTLSSEI